MSETFELQPLQDKAAALVEATKQAGADACDAIVAANRSAGLDVRDGVIEEVEGSENAVFSLRAFVGNRSASVSANMTSDVEALAQRVVAMAKVSPPDENAGLAGADEVATNFPDLDLFDETEPDFATMREIALSCEDAALSVSGVSKSSGVSFSRSISGTVLATSNGFVGSYKGSRFTLSASAVAGEGTAMERDYDYDSQRHFSDLRSAQDIGRSAGERTIRRLSPKSIETQTATVVYEPRMARSLVSHLAGAINAAAIVRKTSFLKDRLGQSILPADVTIVDEPHLVRGVSSRIFDGEGVSSSALPLIEDGVLQTWLLDCSTARQLGLKTNGRASRAGSGTSPGYTNMTLTGGTLSPEELIVGVKNGIYVTELIGQGVNLVNGDYSRGVGGFLIENGELTTPVSEITIASNLNEMFARLQPANDVDKRHGVNAPTIAIEGMTIAGR